MAACAQIEENAPEQYVFNMIEIAPQDFDFLSGIWKDFYPTQHIQWADELVAAPGNNGTVWIGWRKLPDGTWYDPEQIPVETPPEEPLP